MLKFFLYSTVKGKIVMILDCLNEENRCCNLVDFEFKCFELDLKPSEMK